MFSSAGALTDLNEQRIQPKTFRHFNTVKLFLIFINYFVRAVVVAQW